MARLFHQLIFAAALAANGALAQEGGTPAAQSTPAGSPKPAVSNSGKPGEAKKVDEFEDARRIFDKFSPEERTRFRENITRWKNMPPGEQEDLRHREEFRRERIAKEIDESLRKAGLQLDADHRQVFALRYAQERRKIEDKLRKEMEEKRRPLLEEMVGRLKTEFAAAPAASPSASPK